MEATAMNWFHKFFNPHCPDCIEKENCRSCDTLRAMLDQANLEKKQLLDLIIKPQVETVTRDTEEFKPLTPRAMPWNVRKRLLETEDRHNAALLRKKQEELKTPISGGNRDTTELEKELNIGGENAAS